MLNLREKIILCKPNRRKLNLTRYEAGLLRNEIVV